MTHNTVTLEDQKMIKRGYYDAKTLKEPRSDHPTYMKAWDHRKLRLSKHKEKPLTIRVI